MGIGQRRSGVRGDADDHIERTRKKSEEESNEIERNRCEHSRSTGKQRMTESLGLTVAFIWSVVELN